MRCLFFTGASCGSLGTCTALPESAPACADAGADDVTACSCDGTPRIQLCNQPAGYTRGDIVHAGPCADGGQVCHPGVNGTNDCPDQQICGYLVSEGCAATTAHCYDGPDPTVAIPAIVEEACGCDGGIVYLGPGNRFPEDHTVAPEPVQYVSPCTLDAGVDAAADASDAD